MKLIAKYETEQKELSVEVADLEEKFFTIRQDEEDVALFMERLRKYSDVQELTREMCLELIEYITFDAYVEGQPREIYIYYKLPDEPLKDKRSLFLGVFTLFTHYTKVSYYLARGLPLIFTVTWISTLRLTQLIRSPISSVAELSKGRPLRKARV